MRLPWWGTTSKDNRIVGNLIGLTPDGKDQLGNLGDGVLIHLATGTVVGRYNVISANVGNGVLVSRTSADATTGNNTVVKGNRIGTDVTGTERRGNRYGVMLLGTNGTLIGGSVQDDGNLIGQRHFLACNDGSPVL